MDGCSVSRLAGTFNVTASGRTVDVNTGVDSGRVSVRGVLIADGARNLYFDSGPDEPALAAGNYEVQDDCFVKLVMELPADEHQAAAMHFRAIVVDNGREVLGIQTDPGTVVAIRPAPKQTRFAGRTRPQPCNLVNIGQPTPIRSSAGYAVSR
jgi:hypothetical protein